MIDKVFVFLCSVSLCVCVDQSVIDYIGANLKIQFKVVSNLNGNNENFDARITLGNNGSTPILTGDWEIYFCTSYMVEPDHLPNAIGYDVDQFTFNHINGILFKFQPTSSFAGIGSGAAHVINLTIKFWNVARTDVFPRWYVVAPGRNPKIIQTSRDVYSEFVAAFDSEEAYKRYTGDIYSPWTPKQRYDRYNRFDSTATPKAIIPTPVSYSIMTEKTTIDSAWRVDCGSYSSECALIRDYFGLQEKTMETTKLITLAIGDIQITGSENLFMDESYELTVATEQVNITAPTASGAFYAAQSLFALSEKTSGQMWTVPVSDVKDAPRFEYRGMHLDVGRNFVPKNDVLVLLKAMAMYKLNNFHFHLTDDEGWRIEMDKYPELTEIGGKRSHDLNETSSLMPQLGSGPFSNTSGSGFYTKQDYQEILMEAEKLHIRVIPEIDLPGHAHAAVKANLAYYNRLMKEGRSQAAAAEELISDLDDTTRYLSVQMFTDNAVNPCIGGTYKFVRNVVQDMIKLHKGIQNLTVFHLGGDEIAGAWKESPKCQELVNSSQGFPSRVEDLSEYFIINASNNVIEVNSELKIGIWADGALDGDESPYQKDKLTSNDVIGYAWENVWEWGGANRAYKLANAGYKVVMSQATNLYFDQPHEPDPEERGLYWASRFTEAHKTFGFMPDNVYANADFKRNGDPITFKEVCPDDTCVRLKQPQNVIGMQGQLFSENIRSTENFYYMIFPRLLALAERAWHKSSWEATQANDNFNSEERDKDWSHFATAVGSRELARLENLGIQYRLAPPGVSLDGLLATIACEFPGMPVQYKEADKAWKATQCGAEIEIARNMTAEFRTCSSTSGTTRCGRSVTVTSSDPSVTVTSSDPSVTVNSSDPSVTVTSSEQTTSGAFPMFQFEWKILFFIKIVGFMLWRG